MQNETNTLRERSDEQKIMNITTMLGVLLLENGGEVYRSEDTMQRVARSQAGIYEVDVLATPGWLFVSYRANQETLTKMRRVKTAEINLNRVSKLNDISRRLTAGQFTLDEAEQALIAVRDDKNRYPYLPVLGGAIAVFALTLTTMASPADAFSAGVAASVMLSVQHWMERFHLGFFINAVLGAAVSTAMAILFLKIGFVSNFNRVIIGSIMLLFPGISITNSMRDSLSGDFISGITHAMQAVATALGIAIGVGIMLIVNQEFLS